MTKKINTLAIIQARMGSTRLHGKVLKQINGKSMLARVVIRTKKAKKLNAIVIATTKFPEDDVICKEAKRLKTAVFRGSSNDVLDRYYQAAKSFKADIIVRITSDCPLIDPTLVDEVIRIFLKKKVDYASNAINRTYPRGLDVEVISFQALEIAWQKAVQRYEREHVTPFIYQNPDLFRLSVVENQTNYSYYRWTVDTKEDLDFIRKIYRRINTDNFSWYKVIELLEKVPKLTLVNHHIKQKSLLKNLNN